MKTLTATEARIRLFELLGDLLKKDEQVRILYKNGGVVLMSEEDYESLVETLFLLSGRNFRKAHSKAREQIRKGKTVPLDKVFSK